MAPERFNRKSKETGPEADVYSLGATLYEALSGDAPFHADNVLDLVEKIRRGNPPPPKAHAGCPEDVKAICSKALARHPEDRYATCAALALDLDRVLAGRPMEGRRGSAAEVLQDFARERPLLLLAVTGSVVVLALVTTVVSATRARSGPAPTLVPPTPAP